MFWGISMLLSINTDADYAKQLFLIQWSNKIGSGEGLFPTGNAAPPTGNKLLPEFSLPNRMKIYLFILHIQLGIPGLLRHPAQCRAYCPPGLLCSI